MRSDFTSIEIVTHRVVVPTVEDLIVQAERHIESNRKVVEFYRQRAVSGEVGSTELMERFQHTQTLLEANLARLLSELDKASRLTD